MIEMQVFKKHVANIFCFIDGDDFIANDTLENMYNLILKIIVK